MKPKLFVIGDSISMHYGPYLETMIAAEFAYARKTGEEAGANLDVAAGANGGDSGMVLSFLQIMKNNGGFSPDILLVNCGLHDIKTDVATGSRQVELNQYQDNLISIVETVRSLGSTMIWVRTTPVVDEVHNTRKIAFHRHAVDLKRYNEAADEIMRECNTPSIDLEGFTLSLGPAASL